MIIDPCEKPSRLAKHHSFIEKEMRQIADGTGGWKENLANADCKVIASRPAEGGKLGSKGGRRETLPREKPDCWCIRIGYSNAGFQAGTVGAGRGVPILSASAQRPDDSSEPITKTLLQVTEHHVCVIVRMLGTNSQS
jgi:hypothetical protein